MYCFALNPWYGLQFFGANGKTGFLVLGAVVLAVTGAEALYADMGHFGKRPIRLAWFGLVFPALLLNYFGQGAIVLRDPSTATNPFFLLAPQLAPMAARCHRDDRRGDRVAGTDLGCVLTHATECAAGLLTTCDDRAHVALAGRADLHSRDQQRVDGRLSATRRRVPQFDSPGRSVRHRRDRYDGDHVDSVLRRCALTMELVARARRHAHGRISVRRHFAALANAIKFEHGGWVPVAIAIGVFTLMSTWKKGRVMLNEVLHAGSLPLSLFLDDVERRKPPRVSGTAVFMTSSADGVPVVLLHHLKHNKVLHEQVVLMSILTEEVPEVDEDERVQVERLEQGFYRVTARYGFMETPDVPEVLAIAEGTGAPSASARHDFLPRS